MGYRLELSLDELTTLKAVVGHVDRTIRINTDKNDKDVHSLYVKIHNKFVDVTKFRAYEREKLKDDGGV